MHSFLLNIFLNYSVLVAAVIAAIRFKTIDKDFRLFIWLIWFGLFNETLSLVLIYANGYNTINSNIYVLFECFIILSLFYSWQTISQAACYVLLCLALIIWISDNLVWHPLSGNNSVFRVAYSFCIVICCIKELHNLVACQRAGLLKNPVFLICTAFLLYYTCKAFVEVFNAFHPGFSQTFNRELFTILYVADCISNILYAIALLCIPRKQVFTMPY